MNRRNGLTKLEIVITIIVLLFVAALFMPAQGKIKPIAQRVVCGDNLKNLGTACGVYSADYEGMFPHLPGSGPWSKKLGFEFDHPEPDFSKGGAQSNVDRTITASWYLLVRETDVPTKKFVCGATGNMAYDGKNSRGADFIDLWDFSAQPHQYVSYVMHNPYGNRPASSSRPKNFAVAADMSPWFYLGEIVQPDAINKDWRRNRTLLPPYFSDRWISAKRIRQSNAMAHGRYGQNVLFADSHMEYLKTPDVGIKHDNIYTFWSTPNNPTESDIRIGANPTSRSKENDAQSPDDSFLAI